tara:strand:+ start:723 stop:1019 length:297 start_codon:yes stop_codon:yes gene_type:complete
MRTHLFAALVAALSTNVAVAQDDNAITDMISNPILCVSAALIIHAFYIAIGATLVAARWRVLSVVRRGRSVGARASCDGRTVIANTNRGPRRVAGARR